MLRNVLLVDAPLICDIYNHHVLNTIVTFEEEPVSLEEMERRIAHITKTHPWIVYEETGTVIAYAYATDWKARSAYRFSVESTVYVAEGYKSRGIGKSLYTELLKQLNTRKIHSVIGGIALPNDSSIKLHESLGFEKIGQFKEVGLKFGKWVDVGYWEFIF